MKLATNPDIRPHLIRERGRPRNALVWLVTKYPSSSESWQAKAIARSKSNGEAVLRTRTVFGCGATVLLIPHTGTPMDGRPRAHALGCGVSCWRKRRRCARAWPSRSPVNVSWWGSHESRKRPCRVSRGIRATGRKAGRVNSSTDQKPERATK